MQEFNEYRLDPSTGEIYTYYEYITLTQWDNIPSWEDLIPIDVAPDADLPKLRAKFRHVYRPMPLEPVGTIFKLDLTSVPTYIVTGHKDGQYEVEEVNTHATSTYVGPIVKLASAQLLK